MRTVKVLSIAMAFGLAFAMTFTLVSTGAVRARDGCLDKPIHLVVPVPAGSTRNEFAALVCAHQRLAGDLVKASGLKPV